MMAEKMEQMGSAQASAGEAVRGTESAAPSSSAGREAAASTAETAAAGTAPLAGMPLGSANRVGTHKIARGSRAKSQARTAPAVVLAGSDERAESRSARVAATCAASLPPLLLGAALPLLVSSCLTATALACSLASGAAATACMGAACASSRASKRRLPAATLALAACALAAMLALPPARAGLFALVNGIIDSFDNAYGAYVPFLSGTATHAASPLFGITLGLAASALAWLASGIGNAGSTVVVAALACAASLRLGLGSGVSGCVLALGSWIARARAAQIPARTYSMRSFALNATSCALTCTAAFVAACAAFSPLPALDAAHNAIAAAWTEARYGHDTLPQGDLAASTSMNRESDSSTDDAGSETGLTITYIGSAANDLYLRGFVGASFEDDCWSPLGHESYEGEWRGMYAWLGSQGLTSSQQRSAFDDAANSKKASDEGSDDAGTTPTATVTVDASRANRRYVYAPYTLRTLEGASLKTSLEGSLNAGLVPSATYAETLDAVDRANVLADTSWLAKSKSAYANAERVYAAFAEENYLAVSKAERKAVRELVFTDASGEVRNESDYETISRVRAMLAARAEYTENPAEPAQTASAQTKASKRSFVRWFLGEAHAGNSAYFATAAVLAFRSQGIPARYVEGYRASASELAASENRGESLELTAADAHAWAEVYLNGIGWTPVEVTPGFYTQATEAEQPIDVGETLSSGGDVLASDLATDDTAGGSEHDSGRFSRGLAVVLDALAALSFVLLVLCGAALIAIAQRRFRIDRRREHMESADQNVCVPALYAYLADIMKEHQVGFDESRPLDCLGEVAAANIGLDTKEYRRAIELHQAFAFGGRTLRPNELRTLRRFNERLHAALPAPKNVLDLLRRRLVCAL